MTVPIRRRPLLLPALAVTACAGLAWPGPMPRLLVPGEAEPGPAAAHLARRLGIAAAAVPGADGLGAAEAMLAAVPGSALLLAPTEALTLAPLRRGTPLPPLTDPLRAVTPLSVQATDPAVLLIPPLPTIDTLRGFLGVARGAEAAPTWHAGPEGEATDLVMRGFLRDAGLGAMARAADLSLPAALEDLARERLSLLAAPLSAALPAARAARARMIAVAARGRVPAAPEVPTGTELGFRQLVQEGTVALFGWRGMAPDLAARVAAEASGPPAERLRDLAALLASERQRMAVLLRDAAPLPPA